MGRSPCCEKVGLKKGRWTAEEDKALVNYIQACGEGSWKSLPKLAGVLRCGKSCRLRWINYLRGDLKRGKFTDEEEETIVKLHRSLGNKWSSIASELPGRTDNEIKNYWNSHLSRKLYSFTRSTATNSIPNPKINSPNRRCGRVSRSVAKKYNKNTPINLTTTAKTKLKNTEAITGEIEPVTLEKNTLICSNSEPFWGVEKMFYEDLHYSGASANMEEMGLSVLSSGVKSPAEIVYQTETDMNINSEALCPTFKAPEILFETDIDVLGLFEENMNDEIMNQNLTMGRGVEDPAMIKTLNHEGRENEFICLDNAINTGYEDRECGFWSSNQETVDLFSCFGDEWVDHVWEIEAGGLNMWDEGEDTLHWP